MGTLREARHAEVIIGTLRIGAMYSYGRGDIDRANIAYELNAAFRGFHGRFLLNNAHGQAGHGKGRNRGRVSGGCGVCCLSNSGHTTIDREGSYKVLGRMSKL